MLESSKLGFWYLSPTWTRSPSCTRSSSCTRSPSGTRRPIGTGIALGCDLGSPSHDSHPTLCRNVSRGPNPSRTMSLVQLGVLLALGVLK